MPARRDDAVALILGLAIMLGTVALAHLVPAAKPAGPPSTPASFDTEPTCAEWTDGCIVCQRGERGPACSMPGIACVPRERQCLRREGA
jgi:hypothetical protein